MNKFSIVITCFNNESTLEQCLKSVSVADEVIILDSYSTDKTLEIAKKYNCIIHQQKFAGYSKQKQRAIDLANNSWVLLLDSDEYLADDSNKVLSNWKNSEYQADAYELPRTEWVFWKWSHPWVHKNKFIRLFDKTKARVSNDLVHESIKSNGNIETLNVEIKHYGETSISKKLGKINKYSQLAAEQKFRQGKTVLPLKLILYPPFYFFRQYFIRRLIFNGWAGVINASMNSYYAFLKYAKLYELQKNKD
jgi:glycosyltransferase involved in cell wall biosynthesis